LPGAHSTWLDYEQQRLHLLHKHGIDLEDSNGIADGKKTKRMDPKEVELLMGGGEGQGGVFTWREKNRRKVSDHRVVRLDLGGLIDLYS
jgi:hypothetical protein